MFIEGESLFSGGTTTGSALIGRFSRMYAKQFHVLIQEKDVEAYASRNGIDEAFV